MPQSILLLVAIAAVVSMVVLIARFKVNPFIAIFGSSLALALVAGMPAGDVVKSFEAGVGGALGHIAIIIALGTMLGKMLAESGGAEQIANTLISLFGVKNIHWAMMLIGFIVGLPVFFEVGFVLLIPIAFNVARQTGAPLLFVGLPMVAGLSVVHGMIPPHPAALLAVQAYQADIGKTILYGIVIGLPVAVLAGPLFAKFIAPRIVLPAENPIAETLVAKQEQRAHGVVARRRQRKAELGRFLCEELVRRLHQYAGAVAGARIGADRAAMFEIDQDGQRVFDDLVRFAAFDIGNKSDPAGILFQRRIKQAET